MLCGYYSFVVYSEVSYCGDFNLVLFAQEGSLGLFGGIFSSTQILGGFFFFCKECHWYFEDVFYFLLAITELLQKE